MNLNFYERKIKDAIRDATNTGSFDKRNILRNSNYICIFGVGKFFEEAYEQYFLNRDIKVDYLCDNNPNKWGKEYKGIKCISPDELKKLKNVVVIPLIGDLRGVQEQLDDMKIRHINPFALFFDMIVNLPMDREWFVNNSNKFLEVYNIIDDDKSKRIYADVISNRIGEKCLLNDYEEIYSDGEYFDHGVFRLGKNEGFVDCGAYIGDSISEFLEVTENNFDAIYSFEMDKNNFEILKNNVMKIDEAIANKIECFNCGVWNEYKVIQYGNEESGSGESCSFYKAENNLLDEKQIQSVKAVKLDDVLYNKKVTLIKMDIEGAEQNALRGAEKIITTQKPKMAICLYHRIDAFWEIPLYLKSLVPEYKISVRHHQSNGIGGTVCYAYVE
ncbi:hypothetical protein C1H57_00400 [Clostridium sp. 2-1]|uniref:FkbM family methyltransferase n=1 Tax=Clostridium TaxID=1485 RepID=UPI000CDB9CFD|nr:MULTISPECIES: FkbM family methyltransferase [Clostridium]MBN7573061.1 FkbM family methyltransferase [Clostridium beijerinckii]MBN7578400.1 FkbM family methyltransferase [Clostridium beijerinckii]MBN7582835.1 FkbM family methyltransferase [Clostridium beijerinckii]MBO0519000.1 FkbM family methyltransferase [Clostridium beijerinckii]POO93265.1 hypothetical protein C1H57_00400 [Clostridium sp. 2-1]